MNSNRASKILVVLFLILQASLMFIAQDELAARDLAQKSGASDRVVVESGGANAMGSSYTGNPNNNYDPPQ